MRECGVQHAGECGRILPDRVIVETLETHGVATTLDPMVRAVMAWESATLRVGEESVDVSGWVLAPITTHELAEWLGY